VCYPWHPLSVIPTDNLVVHESGGTGAHVPLMSCVDIWCAVTGESYVRVAAPALEQNFTDELNYVARPDDFQISAA